MCNTAINYTWKTTTGWSTYSNSLQPITAKKRRKSNFSVPASICTENVGIHWVFMTKNKEDMKYVPERKLKRSLISNALPAKYIYVQIIKKVFQ